MKFQYLLEIVFIRLTLKTASSQSLKISLVANRVDSSPAVCSGCSHQLQFRRLQRKLDLTDLDPFKATFQPEEILEHSIEIADEGTSSRILQSVLIKTAELARTLSQQGNTSSVQSYEGKNLNLQFRINVSKRQAEKIELNIIDPNGEKEIRQSSRARRPPELNIKTKSILRASSKSLEDKEEQKEDLFRGLETTPNKKEVKTDKNRQKQSQNWEIMSAFPSAISAWIKKKSHKPQEQSEFQQVKELLESHHPVVSSHDTTSKLSIKLKIVILLLIIGVFFLIVDMFKDKSGRKKNQKHIKKPKSHPENSLEEKDKGNRAVKKKKREKNSKKEGKQE